MHPAFAGCFLLRYFRQDSLLRRGRPTTKIPSPERGKGWMERWYTRRYQFQFWREYSYLLWKPSSSGNSEKPDQVLYSLRPLRPQVP